ncbi:hypothetical protein PHISCL_08175 [Aspergillus sclerotialis]|uniref:Uncharacterized protein n=1 Tax=Aspergillus sclerotialis TaxID=2070753 RepID=A0A3A2ZA58_9EURO|nr:hypothetical protein PHISCL_08175 [Aspergillus sclerotialis]
MTTPNHASKNLNLPSPAQLALAVVIVKHKPDNMNIKEHILQIRSFIKTSSRSNQPTSQHKFFDSVSFWQQAYEKSETEQSKLLDRIYELETRNESLLAKLQAGSAGVAALEKRVEDGKRKGNANTGSEPKKRAKTQGPLQGNRFDGGLQNGAGDVLGKIEYLEEVTASFMRHFYTLQKFLQKKANHSSIIPATVNLCKVAGKELLNAVDENKTETSRSRTVLLQPEKPSLSATIRAVESAFQLLFKAIGKLSGTDQDVHHVGQVIYHLVCLYESITKALQKHCQSRAQQEITNSRPAKKQTAKSLRTKTGQAQDTLVSNQEDGVATQITRLLCTMALSLDISCTKDQELLEGFLFILLTRVGKLLCLFVFQDLQLRQDLYVDPAKLPLPEGLLGVELNEESLLAVQMEAKHLIWLLERTIAFLNATSRPPSSATGSIRDNFVSKVKGRLQSTLLRAVFGTDDPSFQNSLQRPISPEVQELGDLQRFQISDKPVSDWFVQEVWRLLGWEVLEKEGSNY